MSTKLPPEGLVRTTIAMPGKETAVPAARLWLLRHSSEQGPAILLPPEANTHNRWSFDRRGHLIQDAHWGATLEGVRPEGFCVFTREATLEDGRTIQKNQLVQLGYNRNAEAIVFFPRTDTTHGNHLLFPDKGMRPTLEVLAALAPIDLRGPRAPQAQG